MKRLLLTTAVIFTLSLPALAAAGSDGAPSTTMESAISKLPHDKAEEFRDALQSAHEENKDIYAQMEQLHQQMHDILVADEFDQEAFAAKSRQLRQLHDKVGANLDEAFGSAIAGLSLSERKMLARAMEREHTIRKAHKAMKKAQRQDQDQSQQPQQ